MSSGGEGIRTPDLFIANEPLSQLSYTPNTMFDVILFIDLDVVNDLLLR
jgi:hypothetical protein